MALHEQSVGATDEWYTPAYVFEAMGIVFDSDPAPARTRSPSDRWVKRRGCWEGCVWLNPPFGGRNGIIPWLERFFEHRNGVALVPDRTSAPWWQKFASQADLVLFVSPKIKFIGLDGSPGESPAQGTALLAKGDKAHGALCSAAYNGLGKRFVPLDAYRERAR